MNEWGRLKQVTAASGPIVTLDEAKRHLKIFFDDDDDEIEGMIAAATAFIDGPRGIGVALSSQTWRLSLDEFPCRAIIVPLGPVTAINSVVYTDEAGDEHDVAFRFDLDAEPVKLWPPRGEEWPCICCDPGALKIEFTCGYTELPKDLRWAILLLVGHFYENREAVGPAASEIPMGVETILARYRVGMFG